jgi:nucleoid-associated protein YejK
MEIRLHAWIVHELIKTPEEGEARLHLSPDLLTIDEQSERLISRLHYIFSQKNEVVSGTLAPPSDALFPGHFRVWRETGWTGEGLVEFSRDSMQALQLSLQGVVGAKGGYLVYAHYRAGEQDVLGIFLVRDREGMVFRQDDAGHYELQPQVYLDLDRLALATRLYLGQEEEVRAEVIKHARSQKDISEYFLNWLALEMRQDNKELTQHFLEAVVAIAPPADPETGEPVPAGAFREQVVQFAQQSPGRTMSVQAFEETFYGDEKPVQDYLNANNYELADTFRVDYQALKAYHFHKFKGDGFYFGTKHAHLLSGKVSVAGSQIIIDDEDLALEISELLSPRS